MLGYLEQQTQGVGEYVVLLYEVMSRESESFSYYVRLCVVFRYFGVHRQDDGEVRAAELLGAGVVDVAVALGDDALADGKSQA